MLRIITGLWLVCGQAIAQPDTIQGYAYDIREDTLRYVESYHQDYDQKGDLKQSKVNYLSPDKEVLATKQLDYRAHPYAPEFTFENQVAVYSESLQWVGKNRVKIRYRELDKPWREKVLEVEEPIVADAGFDTFLKDHLSRLIAGETVKFNFLNPARLDWFRFDAVALDSTSTTVQVKVAPRNTLLRWVVEPILLTYQRSATPETQPRLLHYSGLTNMSIDGKDTLKANIFYEYEDRQPRQIVNLF